MTQLIVVIDTETTGTEPATDRVVELAMVPISVEPGGWVILPGYSMLVNPGIPIPPVARAVHHISNEDVAKSPDLSTALDRCLAAMPLESDKVYAAHNAAFDSAFLPQLPRPWLDTWRIALHLYPDAPSHSNQVLRYYLNLNPALPAGLFPHRALYDTVVTATILQFMLETHSVSELLTLSSKPVILKTCRFGKHAGTLWKDIPRDYLQWASKQTFDGDVKFTIEHYLNGAQVGGKDL